MAAFIISALVGALCVGLGVSIMKGNIELLHSYHRHRVSEDDRLPFGRIMGIGTIIIGVAVILMSVLSAIAVYTENNLFSSLGMVVMAIGTAAGLTVSIIGLIKYNKGIF